MSIAVTDVADHQWPNERDRHDCGTVAVAANVRAARRTQWQRSGHQRLYRPRASSAPSTHPSRIEPNRSNSMTFPWNYSTVNFDYAARDTVL